MSDADSPRRPKNAAPAQRATRFEAREKPLPPPPRPMAKVVDLFDDLADPRTPTARRAPRPANTRQPFARPTAGEQLDVPLPAVRNPLADTSADLNRARMLGPFPARMRPVFPVTEPKRSILASFWGNPWLIMLVGAACLTIYILAAAPSRTVFSNYTRWGDAAGNLVSGAVASAPNGEHSVLGPPTISADAVETVLRQYNSPAVGTGSIWIEMGKRYGIDPAYALAFFLHESTAGTNSGWAGLKPDGSSTHNIGNIICAGYSTCFGRFRDYTTWEAGIEDWYKLIAVEYVVGRGVHTVEQIIPIYAPANDNNDVANYIQVVDSLVESWRQGGQP
jgi:hypothetical protein